MTMLNALLYLVLLLAGTAVSLILADLERAENAAFQALSQLEEGMAARPAAGCAVIRRIPATPAASAHRPDPARRQAAELRPVSVPACITLSETAAASRTAAPATAASAAAVVPTFDFALAAASRATQPAPALISGHTVCGLPASGSNQVWDCCA